MDVSRCRQRIQVLLEDLGQAVEVLMQRRSLLRGSIYTLKRRCGKSGCRCAQGQLHETVCLSTSINGKTKLQVIGSQEIAKVREWSRNYQASRKATQKVEKLCRQLLALCKQLQRAQSVGIGRTGGVQENAES